jgi:phage replication O-like protein O
MNYQQTTQTPNIIFDTYLTQLSFSELKILLYIVRQTYGWKTKDGKRKKRDRITYGQFQSKTGLSRRIISQTIQSLISQQLISVTDYQGTSLHYPNERKGKVSIYYAPSIQTCAIKSTNVCKHKHIPVQNMVYNKTNSTKLTRQKTFEKTTRQSDYERVQELLQAS